MAKDISYSNATLTLQKWWDVLHRKQEWNFREKSPIWLKKMAFFRDSWSLQPLMISKCLIWLGVFDLVKLRVTLSTYQAASSKPERCSLRVPSTRCHALCELMWAPKLAAIAGQTSVCSATQACCRATPAGSLPAPLVRCLVALLAFTYCHWHALLSSLFTYCPIIATPSHDAIGCQQYQQNWAWFTCHPVFKNFPQSIAQHFASPLFAIGLLRQPEYWST